MQTTAKQNTISGKRYRFPPHVVCPRCQHDMSPLDWCCVRCGGPLEIAELPPFDAAAIEQDCWSLWRYAALLPVQGVHSLGEGLTPLVATEVLGVRFFAKLEFLMPSGSYKDRGTAIFVNALLAEGIKHVVEDSSGNAGASLAAYAAAAGIQAHIYIPAHTTPAKRRQIQQYGATVIDVAGSRAATAAACQHAAEHSVYASHVWSPWFLLGHMTCAWEMWEQLGRRVPDAVVCPVGQGNLFLGLARGFCCLRDQGYITTLPRMYAVQAAACAPLAQAWHHGLPAPSAVEECFTIAEGIRASHPVRGGELLGVVRASGGGVLSIDDVAIATAQQATAFAGYAIEPTSAVAVAALPHVRAEMGPNAQIVVPLTGSGLKSLAAFDSFASKHTV